MDIDDQFEDFTTASDWEKFVSRLEQLVSEWMGRPIEAEDVNNNWVVFNEKVTFSDFPFTFSYYKRVEDMGLRDPSKSAVLDPPMDSNNSPLYPPHVLRILSSEPEFPPRASPCPVSECFSIEEFAVLTSSAAEPVYKESKLKILLSSACLAINNTNCNFPVFVQYHMWNQNYYYGIAESSGIRTALQMIRLKNSPIPTYLSGLLDVFKSKIGQSLSAPIIITTHFFYSMRAWHEDFTFDSFPPEVFDMLKSAAEENDNALASLNCEPDKEVTRLPLIEWIEFGSHNNVLPFGSMDDPFLSMELVVGWPSLTDDIVVDSATYTDLEPENAPEWYFGLKSDVNADFRLKELLEGIWNLNSENTSIKDILGKSIEDNDDNGQYTSALDRLTADPVSQLPTINTVIDNAQKRLLYSRVYTDLAPISTENLDATLRFLFPDAQKNPKHPYPTSFERTPDFKKEKTILFWDNLQGIKSAPIGGLVWRLAILIGNLHAYNGSSMAVAHMWTEFVLELRYRLEKSALICGLERGAPNSNSCLLNQKLQMLNCCIEKKIARAEKENEKNVASADDVAETDEESEEEDDDDEFFDCDEGDTMSSNLTEKTIAKLHKPTGRLRKCGRLRLLNTGEPMYIPITQDPAPLTEDVVEEQAKILVELGNDAEGSEMRAKMMSASLLSDMEAFKAANPGSNLEDFVRWYSPRDWIENEEADKFGNKMGELSARMKVPGNLWIDVWSAAQAVPVRRQKRLFDDTREAEKVLHWLGNQTMSEICHLLFPCLIHAAALKIAEEAEQLPFDYLLPATLPQQVSQLSRCFGFGRTGAASEINSAKNLVLSTISRCELEITQIRSFQHKFPSLELMDVLKEKDTNSVTYGSEFFPKYIKIDGGYRSDIGKTVKEIFVKEQAVSHMVDSENEFKFGKPVKRVFVLKYIPPKSIASESVGYLCLPQRMSCLLKDDLFVSAGTFSLRTDLG